MKKKVLIIEDDTDTLEVLAYLAEDLGFVIELSSGAISLPEVEAIGPDLILLDHWIRGAYGGEMCLSIKNTRSTSRIPVILISAHLQLALLAGQCQADAYLAKPFDIDDLQGMIKKFIAI